MVRISESIEPRSPKRAPEAPTETPFLIKREDNTLPPTPDVTYITPILTANSKPKISTFSINLHYLMMTIMTYRNQTAAQGEYRRRGD